MSSKRGAKERGGEGMEGEGAREEMKMVGNKARDAKVRRSRKEGGTHIILCIDISSLGYQEGGNLKVII